MNAQPEHSRAEWVAITVSGAVVLAVLAGIVALLLTGGRQDAPAFTVTVTDIQPVGGQHEVRVEVSNVGGRTAENVQVQAELRLPGAEPVEGEQHVAFLPGGGHEEVVFVFGDDPSAGRLDVRVASYVEP